MGEGTFRSKRHQNYTLARFAGEGTGEGILGVQLTF